MLSSHKYLEAAVSVSRLYESSLSRSRGVTTAHSQAYYLESKAISSGTISRPGAVCDVWKTNEQSACLLPNGRNPLPGADSPDSLETFCKRSWKWAGWNRDYGERTILTSVEIRSINRRPCDASKTGIFMSLSEGWLVAGHLAPMGNSCSPMFSATESI